MDGIPEYPGRRADYIVMLYTHGAITLADVHKEIRRMGEEDPSAPAYKALHATFFPEAQAGR